MQIKVGMRFKIKRTGQIVKAISVGRRFIEFQHENGVSYFAGTHTVEYDYERFYEGIFTESGFSLMASLVSMVVVSILMLAVAQLTAYAIKASNTAVVNSDINTYVNQLRSVLQDPVLSSTALGLNDVTKSILMTDPLTGTMMAQPGYGPIGGAWKVEDVTVDAKAYIRGNMYRLTLGISIRKDSSKVIGYPLQHKSLGDVYCHLNGDSIMDCTGGTDLTSMAQQLCASLGSAFAWNGTACEVLANINTNNGHH